MHLHELEPQLLHRETNPEGHEIHRYVDTLAEADGVMFLCPKCFQANKGPVGTHSVICWSPRVPLDVPPKPGRWNLTGTSLEDLSLVAGSSSVQVGGPCRAHFWIRGGLVVNCS